MACYSPLKAWRIWFEGKWQMVFKPVGDPRDWIQGVNFFDLPCGRCIGCRLERSRQWAVRCVHEAFLHDCNSFLTLTYSPANLPEGGTLVLRDLQLFLKRLRKRFSGVSVRFFACGEYGESFARPHYHVVLFGFDFPDKVFFKVDGGNTLYTSAILSDLWPFGFCLIGDCTFESCAYVARYITKKQFGASAEDYYAGRKPEFVTMSRRPGIGHGWISKFTSDVYPYDEVIVRGKACKPPRYYDEFLRLTDSDAFVKLKASREIPASELSDCRLMQKEQYRTAILNTQLRRKFEHA